MLFCSRPCGFALHHGAARMRTRLLPGQLSFTIRRPSAAIKTAAAPEQWADWGDDAGPGWAAPPLGEGTFGAADDEDLFAVAAPPAPVPRAQPAPQRVRRSTVGGVTRSYVQQQPQQAQQVEANVMPLGWRHPDEYPEDAGPDLEDELQAPGAIMGGLGAYNAAMGGYFDRLPTPTPAMETHTVLGKVLLCNDDIKDCQTVRLQGEDKEVLGVVDFSVALALALESGVDLVLVNETQDPPLCRLIRWSRYKYETEKGDKDRKRRAVTAVQDTKELRLGPRTDVGDVAVKMRQANKFLDKGNKLKITMKFEGREMQFKKQGKVLLQQFVEDLSAVGQPEGDVNFKAGQYLVIVAPGAAPKAAAPPGAQSNGAGGGDGGAQHNGSGGGAQNSGSGDSSTDGDGHVGLA